MQEIDHLPRTVTLGKHDHPSSEALEQIYISVHPSCRCRPEGPGSHPLRILGRSGIIDGMILEIFRHGFAFVKHLFDACMSYIARHHQRSTQAQSGPDGVLCQLGKDLLHGPFEVYLHRLVKLRSLFGHEPFRMPELKLLEEDPFRGYLTHDIPVGAAADTNAHRARGGMARQAYHTHVMNKIFPSELGTHAILLAYQLYLLLPFPVAESPSRGIAS